MISFTTLIRMADFTQGECPIIEGSQGRGTDSGQNEALWRAG